MPQFVSCWPDQDVAGVGIRVDEPRVEKLFGENVQNILIYTGEGKSSILQSFLIADLDAINELCR